jgi:hypothetical protein
MHQFVLVYGIYASLWPLGRPSLALSMGVNLSRFGPEFCYIVIVSVTLAFACSSKVKGSKPIDTSSSKIPPQCIIY